jgi:hypothetical protein
MAKHTFACFNCRTTARREVPDIYNAGDIDRFPRCSFCKSKLDYVGHRGRLPSKTNAKGWAEFKVVLDERKLREGRKWLGSKLAYVASLELEIAKLEEQSDSPGRRSNVREAKKQLTFLKSEIADFVCNENSRHIGLI